MSGREVWWRVEPWAWDGVTDFDGLGHEHLAEADALAGAARLAVASGWPAVVWRGSVEVATVTARGAQ